MLDINSRQLWKWAQWTKNNAFHYKLNSMFPSNASFLKGEDTGVRKLLKTYQYQIRLYNNPKNG